AVTALLALLAQSALRQEMYVSELSEVGGGDHSSSGGGVNRVPLDRWFSSQEKLILSGRVHLVDLLSLP
ncbi:hypothetical protein, partial [Cellvibrio sp. OA-2007]|uniref:hypothetical protein n=1 Tax=Cellvibrio sp. OA-2007 TaxID=529823 RepID=UPI000AA649E5